jgi:hypothetical protein
MNELEAQKRQTQAFIDALPMDVIFSRATTVPNGAGGFRKEAPSPIPPQRVRFLIPGASGQQGERELLDGQVVQVDYILLSPVDADIQRGDWFYLDGMKYEVVTVRTVGGYEKKAEVTNRG